ncbi:MAG: sulfatase-like hydrolase/transferase [Myxococcota bacterium]|nr:sulfatase-like hydrolase/transferase [Myxococcota bacterium]
MRAIVTTAATAATIAALTAWFACAAEPVTHPNLVLVIGDDLAYLDHGFTGSSRVETPNLDRLAREGTVFSHGFSTSSVCRPALRSLLTGLHPFQWQVRARRLRRDGLELPANEVMRGFATLPRLLSERGYASFQAGKFWEKSFDVAGFSDGMQRPGDDPEFGGRGNRLGRDLSLASVADFLDRHRQEPFFLWFAPMLPHRPHDADERFRSAYEGRGLAPSAVAYYANASRFDALVGELMGLLAERGLRERTLVVYLVDNGWDQPPDEDLSGAFRDGPRGKKTMYEIGWRTPIVFSWPGVVPGGRRSDALVSGVDLFPTLLDYAGAPAPGGRPGRSLRATIQEGAAWTRREVIGSFRGSYVEPGSSASRRSERVDLHEAFFLRDRDWWFVHYANRGVDELYEAEADPRAERDVAGRHPWLVARLRRRIRSWREEMKAMLPPAPPASAAPAETSPRR